MTQSWLLLGLAIIFEVAGTISMKLSHGFSKPLPSVLLFIFYMLAFVMLTFALKKIDLGVAYAIWAGAGTALVAAVGIIFFKEPMTLIKTMSVLLIVFGVIGLNLEKL